MGIVSDDSPATGVHMNARQHRVWDSIQNSLSTLANLRPVPAAVERNATRLQAAYDDLRAHWQQQGFAHQTLGAHGGSLALCRRSLRQ